MLAAPVAIRCLQSQYSSHDNSIHRGDLGVLGSGRRCDQPDFVLVQEEEIALSPGSKASKSMMSL